MGAVISSLSELYFKLHYGTCLIYHYTWNFIFYPIIRFLDWLSHRPFYQRRLEKFGHSIERFDEYMANSDDRRTKDGAFGFIAIPLGVLNLCIYLKLGGVDSSMFLSVLFSLLPVAITAYLHGNGDKEHAYHECFRSKPNWWEQKWVLITMLFYLLVYLAIYLLLKNK